MDHGCYNSRHPDFIDPGPEGIKILHDIKLIF